LKRSEREVGSINPEDIVGDLIQKFGHYIAATSNSECSGSLFDLIGEVRSNSINNEMVELATRAGVIGLLGAYGYAKGVLLKLRRSHAATVNPWLIMVQSVSSSMETISEVLLRMESDDIMEVSDSLDNIDNVKVISSTECYDIAVCCEFRDQRVGDILVDELTAQFLRTKLYESYLGVVFARNPAVLIPGSQRPALLAVTLVRSLELLLRFKMTAGDGFRILPGINDVVRNTLCLWLTLRNECLGWSKTLALSLVTSNHPSELLTEASPLYKKDGDTSSQGVASVCQALVALLHDYALPLFISQHNSASNLPAVALALLGEAVARSCRVEIKHGVGKEGRSKRSVSENDGESPYRPLLRRALGITFKSCRECEEVGIPEQTSLNIHGASDEHVTYADNDHYDIKSGYLWSGRFFSHTYTNATPWAVVATIGFAQVVSDFAARHVQKDDPNEKLTGATQWLRHLSHNGQWFDDLCIHVLKAFDTPSMISMRKFARIYLPANQDEQISKEERKRKGLELQVIIVV
jgi:hypothetical protein